MKLADKLASAAKVIEPVLQSQYGTSLEAKKILSDIRIEQNQAILFVPKMQVKVSELLKQNGIK
jgi:hypothetical protein